MVREKEIQNEIVRAFATREDMRLWRANSGVAKYVDNYGVERVVQFGIPGQADLSGILTGGTRLEIEVKRPGEQQTPQQLAFQKMIERFGGVYILAHSVAEVEERL